MLFIDRIALLIYLQASTFFLRECHERVRTPVVALDALLYTACSGAG